MKVSNQQQPPVEHIEMFSTLKNYFRLVNSVCRWNDLNSSGLFQHDLKLVTEFN